MCVPLTLRVCCNIAARRSQTKMKAQDSKVQAEKKGVVRLALSVFRRLMGLLVGCTRAVMSFGILLHGGCVLLFVFSSAVLF